jgi:hypothetical protein
MSDELARVRFNAADDWVVVRRHDEHPGFHLLLDGGAPPPRRLSSLAFGSRQ